MKAFLAITVALVAALTVGPLSGQVAACVSPLCNIPEGAEAGWPDGAPSPGWTAAQPSEDAPRPDPATSSSGLAPWALPSVGALAGATAYTYAYVAGCREADCIGIPIPYIIIVGGAAGAVVGWVADRLIAAVRE